MKSIDSERFGLNTIFYGPPGTGKTYNAVYAAVAICDGTTIGEVKKRYGKYPVVLDRYNELKQEGCIASVTFHPSYTYEEFVEGVRPLAGEKETTELKYSLQSGIFKNFCADARVYGTLASWEGVSVEEVKRKFGSYEDAQWRYNELQKRYAKYDDFVRKHRDSNIWTIYCSGLDTKTNDQIRKVLTVGAKRSKTEERMMEIQKNDIVLWQVLENSEIAIQSVGVILDDDLTVIEEGQHTFGARKVEWLFNGLHIAKGIEGLQNDQAGFEPVRQIESRELLALAQIIYLPNAEEWQKKNYVFLIDEIHQGDIARIFGELVTLIDTSKRIGASEETWVTLPASGESFGVPDNVYLIGTVNAADCPAEWVDPILRRRFQFIQMAPDVARDGILKGLTVEAKDAAGLAVSIDIRRMLQVMNERIACLLEGEHRIGHAFFLELKRDRSLARLEEIFRKRVFPLLEGMFAGDYDKLRQVLGDYGTTETDRARNFINLADTKHLFPHAEGNGLAEESSGRRFVVNEEAFARAESYRKIYEGVAES